MHRRLTLCLLFAGSFVFTVLVAACAVAGEAKQALPAPAEPVVVGRSDRTNCALIGSSDLLSPLEGVWYQTHCLPASAFPQGVATTSCNRPSLAVAEFRQVAPGLFIFRQTRVVDGLSLVRKRRRIASTWSPAAW